MNDVGAASLLPEDVPTTHRRDDEARRESHLPPPPISSPPTLNGDRRKTPDFSSANDDEASARADSEAETIIQSGREEVSPQKRRTFVRHSVDERDRIVGGNDAKGFANSTDGWKARKRRRVDDDSRDVEEQSRPRSRVVSRDGSRHSSPVHGLKRERTEDPEILDTDRNLSRETSDEPSVSRRNDAKIRPASEGVIPRAVTESDARHRRDDKQISKSSRNHDSEGPNNNNNNFYPHRIPSDRSISPAVRSHRRAVSTSLHSSILPSKKRRAPPPLLLDYHRHRSEDRESISSSASGSPRPSLKPRKFASGEYSAVSPAKQTPMPKKVRDQNGRTRLARACAGGETEAAIAFLGERPEDLDIPDNAGNTPLQIAALGGCAEIVKHLLDAGCDINTKNYDKDTPLIDAVENGHLEVVKLLLKAGANPRIGNRSGDEPSDLVPSDPDPPDDDRVEELEELRQVLKEARSKAMAATDTLPRKSEDHITATSSPRELTPAIGGRSPPPQGRRKTGRREATRNDLLWASSTPENLKKYAANGDGVGVGAVLQVLQKADTESVLAAAKGGHDEVLGLLLALGDPNPDPQPVRNGNHKPGYDTPMLSAIGRGHLRVIELLLGQSGFNPTRLDYRGRKYYEISEERKGTNWDQEYEMLKNAYDNYTPTSRKRISDNRSPRKSRGMERARRSSLRRESVSPELTTRRKPIRNSLSSFTKEERMPTERSKREDHPHKSHGDHGQPSMGSSDLDIAHHRKSRGSPEDKKHDDGMLSHEKERVRRRRLFAGRPPIDRASRRPSLISSDSLSSREEGPKQRSDSSVTEPKTARACSPLKRPRSTPSPGPERPRGREDNDQDSQVKRRRVESEEDAARLSSKVQPARCQSRSGTRTYPEERTPLRHIPNDESSVHLKRDQKNLSTPIKERREPNTTTVQDTIDFKEIEAKKAKEIQEAEKRRLAVAVGRERQEREAKEAQAAKDAAEAKEVAEKAARLAREKAEEEERKQKEAESRRIRQAEEEHQKRLEHERLRQARLRREQEEHERRRREALPNRLRSAAELIGSHNPRAKSHEWLRRFFPLATVTTKQIEPSCGPYGEEERWIPNYQIAPLLATNDLQLSQCMFPPCTEYCFAK